MQLKWFQVREFQSVRDSGPIAAADITCLVGKNEAGKSALLKALYRLNPLVEAEGSFSVTRDYPRTEVEDYRHAVESKKRAVAVPIEATYNLDTWEIQEVAKVFGPIVSEKTEVRMVKRYDGGRTIVIDVDVAAGLSHLVSSADLPEQTKKLLKPAASNVLALHDALSGQEQSEEIRRLLKIAARCKERGLVGYIYDEFLVEPKYMYFDEYYQMTGHENIEALMKREAGKTLTPSDHPLLGLIRLARLKLPELLNPESTIELKNKLQGASNHLSKQVLKYWSQNRHLRMEFDVRPARPGDPHGMQQGTNIWGGVFDTRHQVTTELGSRSRGFVWFFSFLAWYSDVKRNSGTVILLLDEPGLTLHAKAQHDLLRYFEEELKGSHQLVYSTHSPFMIDPQRFDRVRIVQDASIDGDTVEDGGTKVLQDVFGASADSLFPLQGALGYELHQTLFVGPNSLVVEGAADLLFVQAMSAVLQGEGRTGLDDRWTVTPVGGAAKVPTFVALLGTQRDMKIATLIDTQIADREKIEGLYKEKLLKKANVLTFADFVPQKEADIEDMFGETFYVSLVNAEYATQLEAPIDLAKLPKRPRIVERLDIHFSKVPLRSGSFSHYRPARYFSENATKLARKIPKETKDRFEAAFKALNALL